jgi:site-specific recombinase XerC
MYRELAEFLDYCRLERRLAPLTCSAYERGVAACLGFLEREDIASLSELRPAHLRRFLAEEAARRPPAREKDIAPDKSTVCTPC